MKRGWLACLVSVWVISCGDEGREPAVESGHASAEESVHNEPIAVELLGRTVRVRCEVECPPLSRELEALRLSCLRDPTAVPAAVAMDGESLRAFGCCHEADRAYQSACGEEPTPCTTGWLAACENAALSAHAHGGGR